MKNTIKKGSKVSFTNSNPNLSNPAVGIYRGYTFMAGAVMAKVEIAGTEWLVLPKHLTSLK
jgi:hypothetical protein